MIEWLKQQYNNLIFELFPILPSYLVRDCYKEFDEKYKEFRIMTENKRFMIDDAGTLIDIQTREMYDIVEEVCPVLNALYNENEQLKEAVWSWSNSYNRVYQENQQLKNLIQHTYQLERTELGRNVLKQLLDQME